MAFNPPATNMWYAVAQALANGPKVIPTSALYAIAIGALVQIAPPLDAAGAANRPNALILGMAVAALVLTAVNMFGGFAVTRRMLAMFRK